jgi:hypothetical protein
MKIQMRVAMKLTTATNRNQCVPERMAGEAQAMQTMPNTWQQTVRHYHAATHKQ